MSKRNAGDEGALIAKRPRAGEDGAVNAQQLVVSSDGTGKGQLIQTVKRTSGLAAPIMVLSGHSAEVLDVRFDKTGEHVASASADKTINLWTVYGDECKNYGVLRGPKGAVLSIAFSPSRPLDRLYAASADKVLTTFDLKTGQTVRKHRGHQSIINCLAVSSVTGEDLLATASDDGTVRIWREESKDEVDKLELGYPILAVEWSQDGQQLFIGGLDNDVHCYDLRKKEIAWSLRGHTDSVCGVKLSPDGSYVVSVSFDSTWDVRPFAPVTNASTPGASPRLVKTLLGAPSGYDNHLRTPAWDPTGARVAVGAADSTFTIWDVATGRLLFKLPGHRGTVTCCDWHPKEPVVLSGGADRQVFMGEIEAIVR